MSSEVEMHVTDYRKLSRLGECQQWNTPFIVCLFPAFTTLHFFLYEEIAIRFQFLF